ncbi:MAG: hypothetical protein AAGI11_02865 [Pseudomonadota bacterium]
MLRKFLFVVMFFYIMYATLAVVLTPTRMLATYYVHDPGGLPLLPTELVRHAIICCKDVGPPGRDEWRLISFVLNGGAYPNNEGTGSRERAIRLVSDLVVKRELDPNWVDDELPLTAFIDALAFGYSFAVPALIEVGADPCLKMPPSDKPYANLNAYEYGRYLERKYLKKPELEYITMTSRAVPLLQDGAECGVGQ